MKVLQGRTGLAFELQETQDGPLQIQFAEGNTLVVDEGRSELRLHDSQKTLQLTIRIGTNGIELDVNASRLNLTAVEEINVSAGTVNIHASNQLNVQSGGNMVQQTEKDFLAETKGVSKQIASVQQLKASLGNVEIKANDNVLLDGEKILLNC